MAVSLAPGADDLGDFADQANADAEAELNIRLRQSDIHLLRAIDAAIRRITQDRFGVCEACGSPISKVRLEALPWTPLCRDCMESGPLFLATSADHLQIRHNHVTVLGGSLADAVFFGLCLSVLFGPV